MEKIDYPGGETWADREALDQMIRSRIERAELIYSQALKSLWIGNAGAALAMLSLIGTSDHSGTFAKSLLWPLGFFVAGLIIMGLGEVLTLIKEAKAIRRLQDAPSVYDVTVSDIENPVDTIWLNLSPRTLFAISAGICFVAGSLIGFILIVVR